jgi:tRNA-modifying protein YgfZ
MRAALSPAGYDAARRGAALVDRSMRGRIVVSGVDRAAYLQGLLSNDIAALTPGQGCYATYLTPQGRMLTDVLVYELGDLILLTVPGEVTGMMLEKLDQFIFTEDVTLGDVTATFSEHAVIGPSAPGAVAAVLEGTSRNALAAMIEHGNIRALFQGNPAIVTRVTDTGEPGFDIFVEAAQTDALRERLRGVGVMPIDDATAETLRIEAGIPAFHRDMDEQTIPLEAGIEGRAISFTKGCYVGQEVIIRVMHRGHGRVARKLVGLLFAAGGPPAPGEAVRSGDREIGHVTSATDSPALDRAIALAYVHRDFVEPGTEVTAGGRTAVVGALPFVSRTLNSER